MCELDYNQLLWVCLHFCVIVSIQHQ